MNRKELAIISVISFLTVLAWIILGIKHANTSDSLEGLRIHNLTPLTPTFDNDIIKGLETREE